MTSAVVPSQRTQRYAAWIDKHRRLLLLLSVITFVVGGYFASHMTLKSSLTALLPDSTRSVRGLNAIEKRARRFGTIHILLDAPDPATRERAGTALARHLAAELPKDLVAQLIVDDATQQQYAWKNRFLFADLKDLVAARDALIDRVQNAKLEANPLYIKLDDDAATDPAHDKLAELEKKLADAEDKVKHPRQRISKNNLMQLISVQTTFGPSDVGSSRRLLSEINKVTTRVRAEVGPSVTFGVTGNITQSLYEHDSVLEGMTTSGIVTVILCSIGLLFYFRAGRYVLAALWALAVGVAATFAMAYATVGSLNVMTAFLFAIVIGNGINPGLVLVARYLDELRAGHDAREGLQRAVAGALSGTFAAMATSSVAYLSLLVTDFRGFRQFGAIAGSGMLLTWITTFTVLPALLSVLARRGLMRPTTQPAIGKLLARALPRRHRVAVLAFAGAVTAFAALLAVRYIANDPFTRDWRDLQSSNRQIATTHALDVTMRNQFDSNGTLSGQAYQVAIAVGQRSEVRPTIEAIKVTDIARPPNMKWVRDIHSIEDLLPADQDQKLALLADIRTRLDDPDLQASLSDDEKARLEKVRPPNDLRALGDADVPADLAWPFIERDGTRGRLIILRGASRFDSFNVADRLAFAREVTSLHLPSDALVAGEALVVADIIASMEDDGPRIIGFALFGSMLTVVLVLGIRRHGFVTIVCGLAGVTVMIAACAIAGLTVHFLDLIALPITIGIGIEYAVNLAARDRQEGDLGPEHLVSTAGSAVLLCSYTTSVGYGTLLLSANGGIRSFGLAALLGELACITVALLVAPTWLSLLRDRRRQNSVLP